MTGIVKSALRDQVLAWLEGQVSAPRLSHCLRVEAMAIDLAAHYDVDQSHAAQAGLMHDLAKCFKPERLLAMAVEADIAVDPVDAAHPHLLHAEVSALVARQEFGIEAKDVLDAIANHTLGHPAMSPLSCIIFLADSLEPGRGQTEALNYLRSLSYQDLSTAVYKTCDTTLAHLMERGRPIHPRALLTRNWFLAASRQRSAIQPQAV
jgi:predicted HD superfamily hydrolase involved in NAD metabolism